MSVESQERVQRIAELVRGDGYEVDPGAVAEAIVSQLIWDDVPSLSTLSGEDRRQRRAPRLRGLVRVRRLAAAAISRPTPLRA